jgi:hypothetical protein
VNIKHIGMQYSDLEKPMSNLQSDDWLFASYSVVAFGHFKVVLLRLLFENMPKT